MDNSGSFGTNYSFVAQQTPEILRFTFGIICLFSDFVAKFYLVNIYEFLKFWYWDKTLERSDSNGTSYSSVGPLDLEI